METAFVHTVMIVEDEEQVAKVIAGLLKRMGVGFVYARDGETGLEKLKKAPRPFSLILSDQRMPGMDGHEFLEKARELSPDSIRFLITGFADIQTIIDAVNQGAIHRYISKPWDNTELMDLIAKGLKEYELVLESERLLALSREQNLKLYKLNKELKEKAGDYKQQLALLDSRIEKLKTRVASAGDSGYSPGNTTRETLSQLFIEKDLVTGEKINVFFAAALRELYDNFKAMAANNGFEMPDNT